jgi:hypothetical protein
VASAALSAFQKRIALSETYLGEFQNWQVGDTGRFLKALGVAPKNLYSNGNKDLIGQIPKLFALNGEDIIN